MNLAVGKGSLQRAANAAGKGRKAKAANDDQVKMTAVTAGAAGNQKNEMAESAGIADSQENEMTESTGIADSQVKTAAANPVQQETDAAKPKKVKKDTAKASKTGKRAKPEAADTAADANTAELTGSKKATKKQPKAARSAGAQMPYLMTVPAEALQDIPDTWRGPKYVRPNVSALAESISKCGILEPVPAVQIGENTYQIVGGSKRMQVVQMLGIGQVPVLVLPGASLEDAWKLYQELNAAAEDSVVQRNWSAANGSEENKEQKRAGSLFGKQRIPEYLL